MTSGAGGAAILIVLAALADAACARELTMTAGGGPQLDGDQSNTTAGIDYSFLRFRRSDRQNIQLGVSYTQLRTDTTASKRMWAASIYPQLCLYPVRDGAFRQLFPVWADPYFFVRALGPSYISANQLGERRQSNHFAFQAQMGLGMYLDLGADRTGIVSLSWKHFSNADLFDDNHGIDVPLVLSLGMKF